MKTITTAILAILLFSVLAFGQNQAGSQAIAEQIRNKNDDATMGGLAECVVKMKREGIEAKDARKDCLAAMKIMSDASKRIANEAADATKASRPVCCGYGWGGYGWGGMWSPGGGYSRYWSDASPAQSAPAPVATPQVTQAIQNAEAGRMSRAIDNGAAQMRAAQEAAAARMRERLK